ncbi:MAG: malonyl CoA-acyl carrier protein transacylase [Candidatus Hydrogenedentota bacterium]
MIAFLFPGQGSQTPGMGRDFYDKSPASREVFDEAAAHGPAGFLDLIFEGPAEVLNLTQNAQPALLTVEAAILAHIRARGISATVTAGHSLGEYAALIAAGCLSFADAYVLVRERGRCMSQYAPEGAMAAVLGLAADVIEAALPEGVEVANFNGPDQTIISGTKSGIDACGEILKAAGAKRVVPLAVSGPFHSSLMQEAAETYWQTLQSIAIASPRIDFVSSVTGSVLKDPEAIREALRNQIRGPVQWTGVMRTLGPVQAVEAGPGKVLQGLAKRTPNAPQVFEAGTVTAADGIAL